MASDETFIVRIAQWQHDQDVLRSIREAVFVVEQNVHPDLEWDGIDKDCVHVIAYSSDGTAVGTGRLLRDGHIGRLAVLAHWRGRGAGRSLLLKLIEVARSMEYRSIALNAQTHALAFYERFGFVAEGDEFDDAGIPHKHMRLSRETS